MREKINLKRIIIRFLKNLRKAENAHGKWYFDGEIDIAREKLEDFIITFGHLLKEQADEIAN